MKTHYYVVPFQGEIQLREDTLEIALETTRGNAKIEKILLPRSPDSRKVWLDLLRKLETDFTALLDKDLVLSDEDERIWIRLPSDAADWLTNLKGKLQQLVKKWPYDDAMEDHRIQEQLMRKMEQQKT